MPGKIYTSAVVVALDASVRVYGPVGPIGVKALVLVSILSPRIDEGNGYTLLEN